CLIGVVTLVRESSRKLLHKANLYAMYVLPQNRNAGVARGLVSKLVSMARELPGLEQINLSVVTENHAARKLYQSFGFQAYGIEQHALKQGDVYFDEEHIVLRL